MPRPHYVIIGAGISGLALGWFLKKQLRDDIDLTILESANRPGGWIRSQVKNGFLFEHGPRSFRPGGTGLDTLQLIEELGLQGDHLPASPAAKKRYIYADGKLHSLPTGVSSFVSSPFFTQILKAIWRDWRAPKGMYDDESIYSFAERRFGASIAETFFDPLVSGIYAGDIRELSLKSCFPLLHQLEAQHRCIWRGAITKKKQNEQEHFSPFVEKSRHQGIYTLRNGVETLVKALAQSLGPELRLNCTVQQLSFEAGVTTLHLHNGQQLLADRLFIAIPPKQLSSMLPETCADIANSLKMIPSASIAAINIGYNSPVLKRQGFGYLIPSKEKQKLLGVVWDSSAFPEQNAHPEQTRLTAMLGGTHFANFNSYTENELIDMALIEINEHLGIEQAPDCININRSFQAIPQYLVGHCAKINELEKSLGKLPADVTLLGNAYYGISVNDCIAHAKKVAFDKLKATSLNF
jgi:protoporphyrinogen/coproporphyrinogen III oxidase